MVTGAINPPLALTCVTLLTLAFEFGAEFWQSNVNWSITLLPPRMVFKTDSTSDSLKDHIFILHDTTRIYD